MKLIVAVLFLLLWDASYSKSDNEYKDKGKEKKTKRSYGGNAGEGGSRTAERYGGGLQYPITHVGNNGDAGGYGDHMESAGSNRGPMEKSQYNEGYAGGHSSESNGRGRDFGASHVSMNYGTNHIPEIREQDRGRAAQAAKDYVGSGQGVHGYGGGGHGVQGHGGASHESLGYGVTSQGGRAYSGLSQLGTSYGGGFRNDQGYNGDYHGSNQGSHTYDGQNQIAPTGGVGEANGVALGRDSSYQASQDNGGVYQCRNQGYSGLRSNHGSQRFNEGSLDAGASQETSNNAAASHGILNYNAAIRDHNQGSPSNYGTSDGSVNYEVANQGSPSYGGSNQHSANYQGGNQGKLNYVTAGQGFANYGESAKETSNYQGFRQGGSNGNGEVNKGSTHIGGSSNGIPSYRGANYGTLNSEGAGHGTVGTSNYGEDNRGANNYGSVGQGSTDYRGASQGSINPGVASHGIPNYGRTSEGSTSYRETNQVPISFEGTNQGSASYEGLTSHGTVNQRPQTFVNSVAPVRQASVYSSSHSQRPIIRPIIVLNDDFFPDHDDHYDDIRDFD